MLKHANVKKIRNEVERHQPMNILSNLSKRFC